MWNKNLIGLLCIISLYGCDQAVSETTSDSQNRTNDVRDVRGIPIGALPIQKPPLDTAELQKRVVNQLSSGQNFTILDKSMLPISESIGGQSKEGFEWRGEKEADKLYLVIRELGNTLWINSM